MINTSAILLCKDYKIWLLGTKWTQTWFNSKKCTSLSIKWASNLNSFPSNRCSNNPTMEPTPNSIKLWQTKVSNMLIRSEVCQWMVLSPISSPRRSSSHKRIWWLSSKSFHLIWIKTNKRRSLSINSNSHQINSKTLLQPTPLSHHRCRCPFSNLKTISRHSICSSNKEDIQINMSSNSNISQEVTVLTSDVIISIVDIFKLLKIN